jgi:hypothetical protein
MKLTGEEFEQLLNALLDAFPTLAALEQMLLFRLNLRLDSIGGGENRRERVFNLIRWAEGDDRVKHLIDGARQENPGNAALLAVASGWAEARSGAGLGAERREKEVEPWVVWSPDEGFVVRRVLAEPVRLQWGLPAFKLPGGPPVRQEARRWKQVHTQTEEWYTKLHEFRRHVHTFRTSTELGNHPTARKYREEAKLALMRADPHIRQCAEKLRKLLPEASEPTAARPLDEFSGQEAVRHLCDASSCTSGILHCLRVEWEAEELKHCLQLIELIDDWLLDILHRADQVLELYFAEGGGECNP